ncbi:MAG: sigma-70 family RNA polymerase sigma factor [Chloroflexi bacterium]|nr:sigma-70 family RNA polymerase sigma factor [Chloroflexota bacterium]
MIAAEREQDTADTAGFLAASEGFEDVALVQRLAGGDEGALAELYDRHGRMAFSLAFRVVGDAETAEEVVQEVFLSVWRRAESYRPDRGSVRAWLLTSVRNRGIDTLRARQSRPRTTVIDDLPLAGPDDPAALALSAATAQTVRAAVAALPPDQRTAVELAYFAVGVGGWHKRGAPKGSRAIHSRAAGWFMRSVHCPEESVLSCTPIRAPAASWFRSSPTSPD